MRITMRLARYQRYKELRAKHQDVNANVVMHWLRATVNKNWIDSLPYSSEDEMRLVPGIGWLRFSVADDSDHDPYDGDGQGFQWLKTGDRDANQKYDVGTHLGDGCYSLDHWDGSSVHVVRFDRKGGGDYAGRREYWHAQGCSKSDADLRARRSIREECKYWQSVAKGDVSWIGGTVTLLDYEEKELGMESVWGFECPDVGDYLLDQMNDWADNLVKEHWKHTPKFPARESKEGKQAWKAWYASMAVTDDDRDISDPVFISTLKGKYELYPERLVQACA